MGDAMEIFVEALLNTHPIFQTVEGIQTVQGLFRNMFLKNSISVATMVLMAYITEQTKSSTHISPNLSTTDNQQPPTRPPDDLSHLFADGGVPFKIDHIKCRHVVSRVRRQDGVVSSLR